MHELPTGSATFRQLNPALFPVLPPMPATAPGPGRASAAERELQRACEHELSRRGIWYLHLSPRAREKVGCPDLLFPLERLGGRFCAVELKSATGRVRPEQEDALRQIATCGGLVKVCRCYDEFRVLLDGGITEGAANGNEAH